MVHRAEAIFCMTEQQRAEVIAKFPEAAAKAHCLHPDGEIGDPRGRSVDGLSELARQIQALVEQQLDGLGLSRVGHAARHGPSLRAPRRTIAVGTSAEAEGSGPTAMRTLGEGTAEPRRVNPRGTA
jgi:hypothetical protein